MHLEYKIQNLSESKWIENTIRSKTKKKYVVRRSYFDIPNIERHRYKIDCTEENEQ